MDHQPDWAAYEKWKLTFMPTRTRGPGSREEKGVEGWAVKEMLMFQHKLDCIRKEEGGSLGRRNSAFPVQ